MALYTPPPPTNIQMVISTTPYVLPPVLAVNINLLVLTEPIPVVQNAFFLV